MSDRRFAAVRLALGLLAATSVAPAGAGTDPSGLESAAWYVSLARLGVCSPAPYLLGLPECGRVAAVAETLSAPYPELRERADPALQRDLEALLARPDLARAVREERLAVALADITDLRRPRLAAVNGDVMVYAASLPKIAILLGVFEAAHAGDLVLTDALRTKATRMIRNSSNPAATELYYAVGPERIADILRSPRYRLYDPTHGGGLWVGKPYAKRDTWRRDPIANLSHGATAVQVARFFYLLETGRLVSPSHAAEMKKMLGRPAIRHKFVKGLASARPRARVFRKSGTWRTYHSDGGIVERDGRRYIAVVLANDPAGGRWLSNLIVRLDALVDGRAAGPVAAQAN